MLCRRHGEHYVGGVFEKPVGVRGLICPESISKVPRNPTVQEPPSCLPSGSSATTLSSSTLTVNSALGGKKAIGLSALSHIRCPPLLWRDWQCTIVHGGNAQGGRLRNSTLWETGPDLRLRAAALR